MVQRLVFREGGRDQTKGTQKDRIYREETLAMGRCEKINSWHFRAAVAVRRLPKQLRRPPYNHEGSALSAAKAGATKQREILFAGKTDKI